MGRKATIKVSSRQCEIAAESFTAYLLARCGYDVLIQYGANQPHYDLVLNKDSWFVPISVKGSQDGGWALAVSFKNSDRNYHEAVDAWLNNQRDDIVFFFVQFLDVAIGDVPRVYVATPHEAAEYMKSQCDGRGYGSLQEDIRRTSPRTKYSHHIPEHWKFSPGRMDTIASTLKSSVTIY